MEISSIISISWLVIVFMLEWLIPHFSGRTGRFRHAAKNITLSIINAVIGSLLFASALVYVMNWAEEHSFGLLHIEGIPFIVKAIIVFLLFDLWMYLWHRANHRIRLLWLFHRVHHTDQQMDVTTAVRFHPGEIIISWILRFAVIPLLGMTPELFILYETCMLVVIFFHHSNIGLSEKWDKPLRYIIVTPNMHRVHHSIEWQETNSNYSSIFSFWDRIARTFQERKDTHTITFGLRILREPEWRSILGILKTPFK